MRPQTGHDSRQCGQPRIKRGAGASELIHHRGQRLGQRSKRSLGRALHCSPTQHQHPGGISLVDQLARQPRLSDAGLAHEHDDRSFAAPRRVECRAKNAELAVASHHHRAQHISHVISLLRTTCAPLFASGLSGEFDLDEVVTERRAVGEITKGIAGE